MIRQGLVVAVATLVVSVVTPAAHADQLVVPAIGVKAPIVEVGLRGDSQATPGRLWPVFHWRDGVKPCAGGSTVLAGHTFEGGAAVFNRLGRLKPGHRIRIKRPGRDCTYKVTSNRLQRASRSVASCYDWDGPARGCLITCVGRVAPGTYTHRRVVRVRLVRPRG